MRWGSCYRLCSRLAALLLTSASALLAAHEQAVAQACAQGVLCVGPGRQFATLSEANAAVRDGSVIELAGGVYHETIAVIAKGVTIRSAPNERATVDCSGM